MMELTGLETKNFLAPQQDDSKQAYEYSISFITKLMHQQNIVESRESLVNFQRIDFQLQVDELISI